MRAFQRIARRHAELKKIFRVHDWSSFETRRCAGPGADASHSQAATLTRFRARRGSRKSSPVALFSLLKQKWPAVRASFS